MNRPHYKLLLPLALISCLSGCINHGESQWITVRNPYSGQAREELVHVKMDATVPSRFTVWAMGGKSHKPSEWVLPGALQTARKLGYRCLQVVSAYDKPLGAEMRDYNESWLTAQASMEPCTSDPAQKRYDLNLNIQKLEPKVERHEAKLDPEFELARKISSGQAERPLPEKKGTQSAASYPELDMAAITRPAAGQVSVAANLNEAVKRIEAQLAQYPEFQQAPPKPRAAGVQILDALTFYPTEAPKPITKFETVDLPFFSKCSWNFSHFLDNDTIVCDAPASKKPASKDGPGYYRLNFEINLKTGTVTPHPELSYDFPGLPARGEIVCWDPISKYMQVSVVSNKPGEEKLYLRGNWGGKIEAYRRDPWMINKYTCKNIADPIKPSDIGKTTYGNFDYLRDDDGIIIGDENIPAHRVESLLKSKGIDNYYIRKGALATEQPHLPFMNAYMLGNQTGDCIEGKGYKHEFWNKQRGEWTWPIPDEITRSPKERGCNALYARPVKPGMVWHHRPNSTNVKGIHFQYWNKPEEVIKLADGASAPVISSPDGCYLIYSHFQKEPESRRGMFNSDLYKMRMTNFCNPRN